MATSAATYPSLQSFSANFSANIVDISRRLFELESANGERFDRSKIVPGTPFDINEIIIRSEFISSAISSLVYGRKSNYVLFPKSTMEKLETGCKNATNTLGSIKNNLNNIDNRSDPIASMDLDQFKAMFGDGSEISFAPLLKQIDDTFDAIITNLNPVELIAKSKGFNPIRVNLAESKSSFKEIEALKETAKTHARTSKGRLTTIQKDLEKAQSHLERISEIESNTNEDAKKVSELRTQTESLIEFINQTKAESETLAESVSEYSDKFSKWDSDLETRKRELSDYEKKLNEKLSILSENSQGAATIISRAMEALELGTAKGLAASFGRSQSASVWTIVLSFLFFVSSLTLFTLLIFVAVAPSLIPVVSDDSIPDITERIQQLSRNGFNASDFFVGISDITVRLLVIYPGFMAVRLASSMLQAGVISRRQYEFKKTLAAALPAFKQQIAGDEGDEELGRAAALKAFEALSENPDTRMRHLFRKESREDEQTPFLTFYNSLFQRGQ